MACERCFLVRGCFIGFTLAFIFGSSSTATESKESFYRYGVSPEYENGNLHIFYTNELDGEKFSNRIRGSMESGLPLSTKEAQDSAEKSFIKDPETQAAIKKSKLEYDNKQYYKSEVIVDEDVFKSFWVDMNKNPQAKIYSSAENFRNDEFIELKFDFPYYGHNLKNLRIAVDGFLYARADSQNWHSSTQCIAPLMANFDTNLSGNSLVKYADNETALTVEWTRIVLKDKQKAGEFTFQTTIFDNGNIVFAYMDMPLPLETVDDKNHSVRVGLSDAYVIDHTRFFVRRHAIYGIHHQSHHQNIVNRTVVLFEALKTPLKRVERSLEPAPTTSSPPSSTQKSQDPTQESPLIKTETGATANVMYSTVNATNSTSESTIITTTLKPNVTKNAKTPIIVSPPLSPVTGQPVHVWANQTLWPNVTQNNTTTQKATDMKPNVKLELNNNSTEMPSNTTDLDDSIFAKFSNFSNSTLTQNNISKTEEDTHQYYNSTLIVDQNVAKTFWVDMSKNPYAKINDLLSKSYRRAATVKLKFDFPFYGHKVRNITIATGGFLYTGEYVHSWLAATQYIAPLMANFDTRLSEDSFVKYADNGTAFTVEWTKVVLQDKQRAGAFTFQTTLFDTGNIVFVYVDMPLPIDAIEDKDHPVKVGLSDAYIMDRTRFFVRKKTIYEYHRVHFNRQNITNWTVIYLRALPTCLQMDNCTDCLTKVPEFSCKWCPELNQCSTGTFRFRQDWLEKGCEQRSIREESSCPANPKLSSEQNDNDSDSHITSGELSSGVQRKHLINELNIPESAHSHVNMSHMSVSGIIGILLVISLVGGLVGWAAYAYRNPHSASGQMLIRYRPSQWSWRRGEARYTAATIHM